MLIRRLPAGQYQVSFCLGFFHALFQRSVQESNIQDAYGEMKAGGRGLVRELQPYPPSDTPTSLYQLLQGCYQPSSHLLFFPSLLLRFPSLPFLSFPVWKSRLGTDRGDEESKRDVEGDVLNYFPNKIGRGSGHCFLCAIVPLSWYGVVLVRRHITEWTPRNVPFWGSFLHLALGLFRHQ